MERLIAIVLAIFCVTNTQAQSTSTVLSDQKTTIIEFVKTTHDFGRIDEEKGLVSHTFEFKNTGNVPFVIYTVNVSCGCTTPVWSKSSVKPNERGKITISFDPDERPGPFEKQIFVVGNVAEGEVKLLVRGDVKPRPRTISEDFPHLIANGLRIEKRRLDLGNVARGTVFTTTLGIANDSEKALKVDIDGIYLPKYINISVEKKILEPHQRGEITIKIDATKIDIWGGVKSFAFLIIDDQRKFGSIEIDATFIENFAHLSKSQLRDSPISDYSSYFYHFSDQPRGAKLEQKFYLSNSGKEDLIIRYIDSQSGNLTIVCDQKKIHAGQTATITVRINNTKKVGNISETFAVITNDPNAPVQEIKVMANIIK